MEATKFWARVLIIFPLAPQMVAITTVVGGGIIINVVEDACDTYLMEFVMASVALSYLFLLFHAYTLLGPWPIKSLRILKIFYTVYGVAAIGCWGIFGSLQIANASTTGLAKCNPTVVAFATYQVVMFWMLFLCFLAFAGKEMGSTVSEKINANMRYSKAQREEMEAKVAQEARDNADADDKIQAEQDEEDRIRDEKEERDRLYASSGSESKSGDEDAEDEDDDDDDDDDDEDEDEDEEDDEEDEKEDKAKEAAE